MHPGYPPAFAAPDSMPGAVFYHIVLCYTVCPDASQVFRVGTLRMVGAGEGMRLINIGFGNLVSPGKIVSVVSPDSAPVKRMVQDARESRMLVDGTAGRRTRAVLVMNSGHVVLSALQTETIAGRLRDSEGETA